ncbi:uncharacterized protein [Panulirus ornatus]|uniref:uncharacterized protein isoform X1 n=1 Tax=Panulirus ornatus TaxID=150431 RepID=UPI003A878023
MDAKLDGEAFEVFDSLNVICKLSCQHGAGLVIRFRRVRIVSTPIYCVVPVIKLLAGNGTECLELEMCGLDDEAVMSVLHTSKSLCNLSLAYNSHIRSLEFLAKLPHLCQLDLSGINLRGKCEGLRGLVRGLEYLRMVGCSLKSADLDVLSTTKHMLSLCHLDLSENFFGLYRDFSSFCKLCQTLQKVSVLEVENCNLNRVTPEMLTELINIFVRMPNLTLLRMTRNDFPSWVILSHLIHLRNSSTLRCLCLTTPSDKYLSDDYTVIDRGIQELQSNFINCLNAAKSTHLSVDWSEETSYSHWYYSF